MTRDDIITTAFRVWGQELYKTTSLAKLAETLGVSKPALYRHFPNKEALLTAMNDRFYDDHVAGIKPALDAALVRKNWQERLLIIVRAITAYYARHFDYFVYSLMRAGPGGHFANVKELEKRGVFFSRLEKDPCIDKQYPSLMLMTGITALFGTAIFHKRARTAHLEPGEEAVASFADMIAEWVRRGLGFDRAVVDTLPYDELERQITTDFTANPPDPLLKAVAETVATMGPWNATMETVAQRSGLSKSGLYAHFKSKQDMLSRLFMSEFERILAITATYSRLSAVPAEQLYLAICSITRYLQTRPEILVALDWIRIQRLDLDLSTPVGMYDLFVGFRLNNGFEEEISMFIPFLLVAVLVGVHHKNDPEKELKWDFLINKPDKLTAISIRKLFRFIALGVEGWDSK